MRPSSTYTLMPEKPVAFGLPVGVAEVKGKTAEDRGKPWKDRDHALLVFAAGELTKTCLRGMHLAIDDSFIPHAVAFRDHAIDDFVRNNRDILRDIDRRLPELPAIIQTVIESHMGTSADKKPLATAIHQRILCTASAVSPQQVRSKSAVSERSDEGFPAI